MTEKQVIKGTASGFHGTVTAIVTFENDQIVDVRAEQPSNTTVGGLGIQRMQAEMTQLHSTDVDTVTGASSSTKTFKTAVHKAVAVAHGKLTQLDAQNSETEDPYLVDQIASASKKVTIDENYNPSPVRKPTPFNEGIHFDATADIIIAGAGGAGLAAAAEAAQHGLKVFICEKAGVPGGSTNLSSGLMQAAGTNYQKAMTDYKNDTPAKHADYLLEVGEETLSPSLVKGWTAGAPEDLDWLADQGLKWIEVHGHDHIPQIENHNYADRIHAYEGGGGAAQGTPLTQTMLRTARQNGAEISYDTAVVSLIQDRDLNKIVGVVALKDDKPLYLKASKGVILATAGIDQNPALAHDINPQQYHDLVHHKCNSANTDTGDGILLGLSVGGQTTGTNGAIDYCAKTGNATDKRVPTIPLIFVNNSGSRFVCEDATFSFGYREIFRQEAEHGGPTYMLFDQNSIHEPGSVWTEKSLAEDIKNGVVQKAETIEDLAKKINVPVVNLNKTLTSWNANVKRGEDPDFNRQEGLKPIQAPYYAYQNQAISLGAIGGLKVNADCEVLDYLGNPISGLLAAGQTAGGWLGPYYVGAGTAISGVVYLGRQAARTLE